MDTTTGAKRHVVKTVLPYNYSPRSYQKGMYMNIGYGRKYKRGCCVWHRRCLEETTHIMMADRTYKEIRNVQVGDFVQSWNGKALEPKKVLEVFNNGWQECCIYNGDLICTPNHKVAYDLEQGKKYKEIDKLDSILCIIRGKIKILPILMKKKAGKNLTYDLTIEDNHSYVANGYIVHNSGKDKTLINLIVREAFTRVGTYHYIFPFYSQGRKVIWDGMDERGFKFLDHIPKQVRKHVNKQEMKIELKPKAAGENGSVIQIVGSDNIDCYDEQTEILTNEGWKYFGYIKEDEVVLTYNKNDDSRGFYPIKRLIKKRYDGNLLHFTGEYTDLLVTPNHKMCVRDVPCHRGIDTDIRICQAIDLAEPYFDAHGTLGMYFHATLKQEDDLLIEWDLLSSENVKEQEYHDDVYCVEVKNNLIFVRRNGKISISHNSVVGTNPVGVVYSEMALQNPEAWDFFRPILAQNGGWMVGNSTPRGMNWFHELFQRARAQPERWYCELLTVDDTKAITEEAIQNERDDGMSEELIEQEYYCKFDAEQSQQLISWATINEALKRNLSPQEYEFSPVLMGVDVALGGDDLSVICVRQGLQVHEFASFSKYDPSQLTGEVIAKINKWKPSKIFIDLAGGYGAGVYYNLRDLGYGHLIYGVNGGKSADDKNQFEQKRSEVWWRCKIWIENGGALPKLKDRELLSVRTDLASQIYEHNKKGQISLWSKKKMKKEHFNSPDHGDALCYTFAYEVPLVYDPDSGRSIVPGNYGRYDDADLVDDLAGW